MIALDQAVVYDLETFPNAFTLNVQGLHSDLDMTFEISSCIDGRDHRRQLFQWFDYWRENQTPMLGFNNVGFDYCVLHYIWMNPELSVEDIYDYSMSLINAFDRFNQIWQSDRLAPQIDLFKIMHFDNKAKSTNLKALQFAMRSETVMESPVPFGKPVTREQIDRYVIPYNRHDVNETKRFALMNMDAIKFRARLSETLRGDVLNFSDGKIGRSIIQQRLGVDSRIKTTPRESIALADIIFPYIQFRDPELSRVLAWMRTQTLREDEITGALKTKGVFTDVKARVGGIDFHFGTGGIHGSVEAQRFAADDEWGIYDIDVAGMYPAIAIVNRLYPEHLGERFVDIYKQIPEERALYKKGTSENSSLKLAGNVPYGDSNNKYSFMFDPKYTMTTTINGQLMLCMLAEFLLTIPTLSLIQINTDGVTYRCRRDWAPHAEALQRQWEKYTCLTLEQNEYSRMWIRDVNNYCAEDTKGKLKQKGAYWFPRNFPDDISNSSPPAWHKDFSAQIVIMAAVEHMTKDVDIERFIYGHADPFDFMCRAKCDRSSRIMIGNQEAQRITRYYVSTNGAAMRKVSPPAGPEGTWKRKSGLSDAEYYGILRELPAGVWDERIHTKNKSKYVTRETAIESGYLVTECNVASTFDFANLNYDWYIQKARELVIS